MDKIPAALQHKIDYIKALDIPINDKYQRIGLAMIDYRKNLHVSGIAPEGMFTGEAVKEIMDDVINDDKDAHKAKLKHSQPLAWYVVALFLSSILVGSLGLGLHSLFGGSL